MQRGEFASRLLWEAEGIDVMTPQEKAGLFARLNRIATAWGEVVTTKSKRRKSDPFWRIPPKSRRGMKLVEGNEPDG